MGNLRNILVGMFAGASAAVMFITIFEGEWLSAFFALLFLVLSLMELWRSLYADIYKEEKYHACAGGEEPLCSLADIIQQREEERKKNPCAFPEIRGASTGRYSHPRGYFTEEQEDHHQKETKAPAVFRSGRIHT